MILVIASFYLGGFDDEEDTFFSLADTFLSIFPSVYLFLCRTVIDGVVVDMEIGSHKYYPDFVREMWRLMNTDPSKQCLITAATQCPFPDKWMGPQIQGSALEGTVHPFSFPT